MRGIKVINLGAVPRHLSQVAPGVTHQNGGMKPVYVPRNGDPASVSIADNLFWNDIMSEHALFFSHLLPGEELAPMRERADAFHRDFKAQFDRAMVTAPDQYQALNQSTINKLAPLIDFKNEIEDKQTSGQMHSLIWPLFADHTRREAERFRDRLGQYSRGQVEYDPNEVVDFWSRIMGEHAEFIAHLLDPQEKELVQKANEAAKGFSTLTANDPAAVNAAANQIVDFKTAAEAGINSGAIKSIIEPPLADHVRREAVKFVDELKRSGI